jgi:hypothetical protein
MSAGDRGAPARRIASADRRDYGRSLPPEIVMTHRIRTLVIAAVLAVAGAGYVADTFAQTQGGQRRGERRDTRQGSRDEKQACKAGDEKSRPECRQEKRDTKQEGRQD